MTGKAPGGGDPAPEELTTAQAAEALGISQGRVEALIRAGRLPAWRMVGRGRPWRIRAADLALVAERRSGWPGQRRHRHKGDPR
jgi:excisionase family DNA binding protein